MTAPHGLSAPPDRPPRATRDTLLGAGVLAGVLAAAVLVAAAWGAGRPLWGLAVGYAAVITGVSSIAGWIMARRATTDPLRHGWAALVVTVVRVFPATASLAWLSAAGGPLREAGAAGLIVAFYLVLLAATIFLHMMWDRTPASPRG